METRNIVVIAASRGGFEVLKRLAECLPADLAAAVFVVLHIGRHGSVLPELLTTWGSLGARYAGDGEPVEYGAIRVAPPDRHLVIDRSRTWLSDAAKENFSRPAADPLFRSAAVAFGPRVVGVVLSGDLDDGAAGLAAIRARGGYAIVQDPADCEAPSMPRAALESCGADVICEARDLASCIVDSTREVVAQTSGSTPHKPFDMFDLEARIAANGLATPEELDDLGERSALTCPVCGGTLWRIRHDLPLRYRCHMGHAFTQRSLEEGYATRSEEALWPAIRAVHERVIFAQERQRWAERVGNQAQIAFEQARIEEDRRLIDMLRGAMMGRG